jgi:two-component system, cell cycle sensor histidine kinase and response regulator CckA
VTASDVVVTLRESEARFRLLFENLSFGVAYRDRDRNLLWANPAARRILELGPRWEAIHEDGTPYPPEERPSAVALRTGKPVSSVVAGIWDPIRKSRVWVLVSAIPEFGPGESQASHVFVIFENITPLFEAREALRRKDEALEQALAVGDIGTWTADFACGTLDFSPTSARHSGLTSGTYPTEELFKLVHPDDAARVKAAFSGAERGFPYDVEFRVLVGNEVRWVHSKCRVVCDQTGKPVVAFGVTQDLTARVRLEERLRRSQKLEAVGQLAGGVAHDFNNALMVIGGNVELILSEIPEDDPNRRALTDIQAASARAAGLTQQLLAFGRKQMLEPRLVDAHAAVAGVTRALGPLLRENIEIRTAFSAVSTWVKVDPNQLEEALVHLSLNAMDAMPAGGLITIRTDNVERSESVKTNLTAGLRHRQKLAISVTDTGRGMLPEVKSRLFEPFFTTKEFGRGSGLGLATIFGFVKQSGGDITVESEPGKGATFTIVLPVESAPEV